MEQTQQDTVEANGSDPVLAYQETVTDLSTGQLVVLDEQAAILEARLNKINAQRKAIRAVLRAFDTAPQGTTKKRPPRTNARIAADRIPPIREWVLAQSPDTDLTTRKMAEKFGFGDLSVCSDLYRMFREEGIVRLAGTTQGRGGQHLFRRLPQSEGELTRGQ